MNTFFRALIALLIFGLPGVGLAGSVCTDELRSFCANHSACQKPNISAGVVVEPMTPEWIKRWLDEHNKVRASVYDAKPPLPKLAWSAELAEVAQGLASTGQFNHDTVQCRRTHEYANVGQNLFLSMGYPELPPAFAAMAVSNWQSERFRYTRGSGKFVWDSACGHYTQLVWRETKYVGCGVSRRGKNFLAVCNYGPGGNMSGATIY